MWEKIFFYTKKWTLAVTFHTQFNFSFTVLLLVSAACCLLPLRVPYVKQKKNNHSEKKWIIFDFHSIFLSVDDDDDDGSARLNEHIFFSLPRLCHCWQRRWLRSGGGVVVVASWCLSFRALRSWRAKRTRPMNVLELLARYYITQAHVKMERRWRPDRGIFACHVGWHASTRLLLLLLFVHY